MTFCYKAPFGWLKLSANDQALQAIAFRDEKPDTEPHSGNDVLEQAARELDEYFEGSRKSFSVPLSPAGTDFQRSVWGALRQIPYGQTVSYGQLAEQLGDPNKVRAVGTANGKNPIPIIIPCHRVIGANQQLVGYSGGIDRKKYLLKHEGALLL